MSYYGYIRLLNGDIYLAEVIQHSVELHTVTLRLPIKVMIMDDRDIAYKFEHVLFMSRSDIVTISDYLFVTEMSMPAYNLYMIALEQLKGVSDHMEENINEFKEKKSLN